MKRVAALPWRPSIMTAPGLCLPLATPASEPQPTARTVPRGRGGLLRLEPVHR